MSDNASLQVLLLSRDRPYCLHSALSKSGNRIEVIVSDDSERADVACMLAGEFPQVRCIYRASPLGAVGHFRAVIGDATSKLLVVFHDDGVLLDGYAKVLHAGLEYAPSLAAECSNALIPCGSLVTQELLVRGGVDLRLRAPGDLLRVHFSLSPQGPTHFSGYKHHRIAPQCLRLNPRHGGKCSDVTFLQKVLSDGVLLWLAAPLIGYRLHGQNNSSAKAAGPPLHLLRKVYGSIDMDRRSPPITRYSYRCWMSWWRSSATNSPFTPWHRKVVRRILLIRTAAYALTRATPLERPQSKLSRMFHEHLRHATALDLPCC
jgi:hypothetical protein